MTGYAYAARNELSSVTDPAGRIYRFFYEQRGLLKASQYPNGTFSWTDVNPAGWTSALYNRHGTVSAPLPASVPADSLASPLADYSYLYNLEGQKTQELRTGGGLASETSSYGYDNLGRLGSVTLPSGIARQYLYDLDSNRTAILENAITVSSSTYDPNVTPGVDQLTSVTAGGQTKTFSYHADGEVTQRGADTLSWDGWGRHSGGTFSGTSVSYNFDPVGFRRQRTGGGVTTRYLLGGLFDTDAAGTITLTDVDGPGDLAHYAGPPTIGSTASFLYYNAHGDLSAEADLSGNRTAAYTYDPFGAPLQTPAANTTNERWTGRFDKKLDSTTNLIEMGARAYDPSLGRFISVDPLDGGALNAYDYSFQDPVTKYDLDGSRTDEGCPSEAQHCGAGSTANPREGAGGQHPQEVHGRGAPSRIGRLTDSQLLSRIKVVKPDVALIRGDQKPSNVCSKTSSKGPQRKSPPAGTLAGCSSTPVAYESGIASRIGSE